MMYLYYTHLLKKLYACLYVVFELRNDDDRETDDELVEGSLEDGKSDSCNNCGCYLDNMTEMEERFDARTHKLEETHDQELQELRKSHNEGVATLRNDNAGLK
jgi:hypothetical protein